jgi:hypothetical protein
MSHSAHQDSHATNGKLGYETREVNIKLILLSTVAMVILVLVTCFITVGIFDFLNSHSETVAKVTSVPRPKEIPPEPRVLEHPWEQLPVLHETEDRVLNSYGWMDQKTGVVRIPVDRAIDILAERGLPSAPPVGAPGSPAVKKPAPAVKLAKNTALIAKENGGQ